jgi:predicted short-subunit dehydrogenase-like oxidoreductase (DUF2520 family)
MRKISIIGVGRVGGALAVALSKKGVVIDNLIVRNGATSARIAGLIAPPARVATLDEIGEIASETVLIAAQDFEIAPLLDKLAGKLKKSRPAIFHTSGALSSEILRPLAKLGCPTGSIHPLVSLSDAILGAERFDGAYFCVEGETQAVREAEKIVELLGGRPFTIGTEYKSLYHAAAVTACGHLVALVDTAVEMLQKCGLSEKAAQATLLPLIKSTIGNLEVQTAGEALTGTFARADVQTFEKHLAALDERVSEEARGIYLQLGARSAHLAKRQGANPENIGEILDKISLAKKNFKC